MSVENQDTADERIPLLLQTPAAVRFVSLEPLLSHVDFEQWLFEEDVNPDPELGPKIRPALDWVIVGGESGPNARPSHPDWFRSVRDDCQAAGVPFFFKQWGEWAPTEAMGCKIKKIDSVLTVIGIEGISKNIPVGTKLQQWSKDSWSARVAKKRAGRLLDGREWNEFPRTNSES